MRDFQYEVVTAVKNKEISSIDIDFIKDYKEYRVGFGRLTENFFNNNIMEGSHYEIKDFSCDLKRVFSEILNTEKKEVVVGFKNMMHDLYTIVTKKRPEGNFHIGEFLYNENEDNTLLLVLQEISLVNKIMFQLRLNKKTVYSPSKAIRIGKYYLKDFNTVFSMKTNFMRGKKLSDLQYNTFKLLADAYNKLGVEPKLYLIPDKVTSTVFQTKYFELDTPDEIYEHLNVLNDYQLNNVLRNTLFNLIVFLIMTNGKDNTSKEWNSLVKKLERASGVSSKTGVLPDLFAVYHTFSVFIYEEKVNFEKVGEILFELYQLAQKENHTPGEVVKKIIDIVDRETTIRFYEFSFKLKETGGKEIKVTFTEIESIFNMALDKVGEYFGLYKMRYSPGLGYLYNDVVLHLILTYTKVLIEEVFKKLSPEHYKRLIKAGDTINIENILKMLIAKYFSVDDVEKLLKINTNVLNELNKGIGKARITNRTYRFNFYINRAPKKMLLLSNSSFLTLDSTKFLTHLKYVNSIILVNDTLRVYGDYNISNRLGNTSLSFKERVVENEEDVKKTILEVNTLLNKVRKKVGDKYNVYSLLLIDAESVNKNDLIINPPKMITTMTLKLLVKYSVKTTVKKVLLIIESKEDAVKAEKETIIQHQKLLFMFDSLNIISTIPLPYTHLITNILKELISHINLFKIISFLIKNKFMTEGYARYINPGFKVYGYLMFSYLSAIIFKTLLNTIKYIEKKGFNKTYMIFGNATTTSVFGELIINTTMLDKKGVELLNGLVGMYNLNKTGVKIFHQETTETTNLIVFSIPIVDIVTENNDIPQDKFIERVNYNVIMSYKLDKSNNFKMVVRTTSRLNIEINKPKSK